MRAGGMALSLPKLDVETLWVTMGDKERKAYDTARLHPVQLDF